MNVVRATPDSAVEGDTIRVRWVDVDGQEQVHDVVVVASRPAGRNFVDCRFPDGSIRYMFHNYEVINRADPNPVGDSELRDRIAQAINRAALFDGPATTSEEEQRRLYVLADAALTEVAPVLAAREVEVKRLQGELAAVDGFRQQYAKERDEAIRKRDQLREYAETTRYHQQKHAEAVRELEKLRAQVAELKIEEDNAEFCDRALHLVLGCCDPAADEDCPGRAEGVYEAMRRGGKPPYLWQELSDAIVARTNELERLRKQNTVLADGLQRSAYAARDILQLKNDLAEARAELDALKAEVVVLPTDWRDRVAEEVPSTWLGCLVDLIESWRGQPDTEPSEQAGPAPSRAEWLARHEAHYQKSRYYGAGKTEAAGYADRKTESQLGPEPPEEGQPDATATPTEPRAVRPVYAEPGDVEYEYDEDGKPQDPAVRWPIAWGCTVSIGRYDGALRFTVSISDDVQRDGIAVRSVTREQIRVYAHHLIQLTEVVEDAGSASTAEDGQP